MKRINGALILLCLLFASNIFSQTYWYVQFRNNFVVEDDQIGVGEWGQDPYPYDSPHYEYIYNNEVVKLEAYDNQWVNNNDFKISFNDTEAPYNESKWEMIIPNGVGVTWTSPNQVTSFTANTSILPGPSGSSAIVEADMKRWVRIKFSNQFSGTSTGGQMIVNSQTFTAPTSNFEVIEENSINFNAILIYDINNIRYIFNKWSDNVTSRSRTETLYFNDDNDELTAIYKGYPTFDMRNLVISGVREGKDYYIKLDWNEHPNSYVTKYHIYRYTKYGSVTTNPVLVATRNRGTTTFTDYAFTYAPSTGD